MSNNTNNILEIIGINFSIRNLNEIRSLTSLRDNNILIPNNYPDLFDDTYISENIVDKTIKCYIERYIFK